MSRRQKKSGGGVAPWMASFADLVTNLLVFFVMLYSTSSSDTAKMAEFISSFTGSKDFISENTNNSIIELPAQSTKKEEKTDGEKELEHLKNRYEEATLSQSKKDAQILKDILSEDLISNGMNDKDIEKSLEVSATEEGVLVRLKDGVVFDPGSAEVKDDVRIILSGIGKTFGDETKIKIEGHTDNVPAASNNYKTNWELSTARATSVMKYFTENKYINEPRCVIAGYAEYKPIAENDTSENKSKNRRVDIIILN